MLRSEYEEFGVEEGEKEVEEENIGF